MKTLTELQDYIKSTVFSLISDDVILARWYKSDNWGDALSPWLIELLSGKSVIYPNYFLNLCNKPVYSATGSILDYVIDKNLIVWGTGFQYPDAPVNSKPREICAVRGPLTRRIFLKNRIDCPEIYGDPALLLPRFYSPDVSKKHRIGIVPHYMDAKENALLEWSRCPGIKVINVRSGIKEFIQDVCSCEVIASSSLHGLICADAYGIPNIWIKFSDRILGGSFKFRDYFESVGMTTRTPLEIDETTTVGNLLDNKQKHQLDIDMDALLDACPFNF